MSREDFFDRKKPWSRFKDLVIEYYITPYLRKVTTLRRTMILLIDGFAGPGMFGDGSKGSPILMAEALKGNIRYRQNAMLICIEKKEEYAERLKENLRTILESHYEIIPGDVNDSLKRVKHTIQELKKKYPNVNFSVFLYLDPFGIKGINYATITDLLREVQRAGTEILLNFNYIAFKRNAFCSKTQQNVVDLFGTDEILDLVKDYPESEREEEQKIVIEYFLGRFKRYFKYGTYTDVREAIGKPIKYFLVFFTNNKEGVKLMNEAINNAREKHLYKETLIPYLGTIKKELKEFVEDFFRQKVLTTREDIYWEAITKFFGNFGKKHLNEVIYELIEEGKIVDSNFKSPKRINDDTLLLWADNYIHRF